MKMMSCKMYFSQALGELPSDPNHLMKGWPSEHGECCQQGIAPLLNILLQGSGGNSSRIQENVFLHRNPANFFLFSFVLGLWQATINWTQPKIRIRWWTEISSVNFSQFDKDSRKKSLLILHLSPIWFRKLDHLDQDISYCSQGILFCCCWIYSVSHSNTHRTLTQGWIFGQETHVHYTASLPHFPQKSQERCTITVAVCKVSSLEMGIMSSWKCLKSTK